MHARRLACCLALAALLAAGGCGGSGAPAAVGAIDAKAKLHRQGRWLMDAQNRVVLLHGVNAVNKRPPYALVDAPDGFTAADADFLAANGFNAVRLGVLFAGVMPREGVIDTGYFDRTDRVLNLLAARGIWALLDFHQDQLNEKFQGEGFPDWAIDAGGLPNDAHYGFPLDEFLSLALNAAYDHFWSNRKAIWDRYTAAWIALARHEREAPYLLGYDLFNEPWPGTQWPACFERDCAGFDATLQRFQQQVLAGIRSVDPDTPVFFEPQQLFDFGAPSGFGAAGDANLALSWHDYCSAELLAQLTLPAGPDCPIIEPRTADHAEQQAAALGASLLLTEFGASDNLKDIARVIALADARLFGWTYWAYKTFGDPTGSGNAESLFVDDGDLTSLKPAKADVLIRPYAQAIAGVPQFMSFDPASKQFTLHYSAAGAAAPTVIFVPPRHYPRGYAVQLSDGRVVSAAGAARLEIVNDAPAALVTLELRPAP